MLNWTKEIEDAFETLRTILTSESVLIMPDFTRQFILHTDASDKGYGAVLAQERSDGVKLIAYYSKTMSKAQLNYSVSEKELLAIVMATEHFHQYSYGVHFVIQRDHQPLAWLLNKADALSRITRWLIRIRNYDFKILYKTGSSNGDADALSRWLYDENLGETEEDYDDTIIYVVEDDLPELDKRLEQEKDHDIK